MQAGNEGKPIRGRERQETQAEVDIQAGQEPRSKHCCVLEHQSKSQDLN